MEVLREKIAKLLRESGAWDEGKMTDLAESVADRILALPEIADGMRRLRLPERQGMTAFEYEQVIAEQELMLGHTSGTREPE